LPDDVLRPLLPTFLFLNGTITTFLFVGALLLFEKSEGVLQALVVTPLRVGEFVASKVASLTALAVVEGVVIVALGWGFEVHVLPLLLGLTATGVLYTLFGFALVLRYDAVNEYILPAGAIVGVLQLPMLGALGIWEPAVFWLWPTTGALRMLQAGFEVQSPTTWIYAVGWTGLWIGVGSLWCRAAFVRFVVRSEGA
jgi:fluoroquinolone transport system permease protein